MTAREGKELLARWLADGSLAERLPEVDALHGVAQPPEYHGEGDAYVHTMLAVEAVADDADPRVFWGTLLHDIGKAQTTEFVSGHWHSYGHEAAGARLVPAIMARLGLLELAHDVTWLVRHHDFLLSWQLQPGMKLSARQRRFMEHPLFLLLLQVNAADAAGARGRSHKGEDGRMLADMVRSRSDLG
jgi:putative nucleotidyltransferase with HDIG domain